LALVIELSENQDCPALVDWGGFTSIVSVISGRAGAEDAKLLEEAFKKKLSDLLASESVEVGEISKIDGVGNTRRDCAKPREGRFAADFVPCEQDDVGGVFACFSISSASLEVSADPVTVR
jgi:hypothetical protein